jgi:predicted component of type VI protein secretion system
MEQQKLRELLDTLHQELEQVDSVDDTTEAVLSNLRSDMQRLLNEKAGAIHEDASLMERMNGALDHFEEGHPKLSLTLQLLLESLAKMGF